MAQDGSTTLHLQTGFYYHSPSLLHMFSTFGSEIRLWITAMLNMFILAVLRDILALMSSLSLALSARYHFLNQAKPSSFYQTSYHLQHLGGKLCLNLNTYESEITNPASRNFSPFSYLHCLHLKAPAGPHQLPLHLLLHIVQVLLPSVYMYQVHR